MANALKGASLPRSDLSYGSETLNVTPAKIPVLYPSQLPGWCFCCLSKQAYLLLLTKVKCACLICYYVKKETTGKPRRYASVADIA